MAGLWFDPNSFPAADGVGGGGVTKNISYTIFADPQNLPDTQSSLTYADATKAAPTEKYDALDFVLVQHFVNTAIIQSVAAADAGPTPSLAVTFQRFPVAGAPNPKSDIINELRYSIFRNALGPLLTLISVIMVYRLVGELSTEKELRLKETFMIMGLRNGSYWCAAIVNSWVMTIPALGLASLLLVGGQVLPHADSGSVFLLLLCFSVSTVAFGCVCASISETAKIASPVSVIILFGLSVVGGITTESISLGGQICLSLLSPSIALTYAMHSVITLEHQKRSFDSSTWNFESVRPSTRDSALSPFVAFVPGWSFQESLSPGTSLALLIVDTFLYALVYRSRLSGVVRYRRTSVILLSEELR